MKLDDFVDFYQRKKDKTITNVLIGGSFLLGIAFWQFVLYYFELLK